MIIINFAEKLTPADCGWLMRMQSAGATITLK